MKKVVFIVFCTVMSAFAYDTRAPAVHPAQEDPGQTVTNDDKVVTVVSSATPEHVPGFRGSLSLEPTGPATTHTGGWFNLLRLPKDLLAPQSSIIGQQDDRVPPSEPKGFPYRATVSIIGVEGCTGWFVGPDIVATAGHCVYPPGAVDWAPLKKVIVIPGRHGEGTIAETAPFGTCRAVRLFSTHGWTKLKDERYDYGAIKLDCDIGKKVGWLGFGWSSTPRVLTHIQLVGYRTMRGPKQCSGLPGGFVLACLSPAITMDVSPEILFYDADTSAETSGGPVLSSADCPSCAIGLHTSKVHEVVGDIRHQTWNHGVAITRQVFENLRAWRDMPK